MKQLKIFTLAGILFVLITGTLAHFFYDWTNHNPVIGFFVPVNESVWEHMKLLFFPMLLYAVIMIFLLKDKNTCVLSALFFGILVGTWLIPAVYYAYTYIIGKNIFLFDIGIFILSVMVSFLLFYRLSQTCRLKPYAGLLGGLIFLLFLCFVIFTHHPPDFKIFQDPTVHSAA